MEVKSVTECLDIVDFAIVTNMGSELGLEKIHKYLLQKGQSEFFEDKLVLTNVLR